MKNVINNDAARAWVKNFTRLETPRLYVRPLAATDDQLLYEAMQNPRVNQWVGGFDQPFDLSAARRWLAKRLDKMEQGLGVYGGVFYQGSDVFMGFMYAVVNNDEPGIEIAGALNELYWGKGFVEEFTFALISDLFSADVPSVFATSALDNLSSVRALQAFNFEQVGEKEIPRPDGTLRPSRYFKLTPERWKKAIVLPLKDGASHEEVRARRRALIDLCQQLKSERASEKQP